MKLSDSDSGLPTARTLSADAGGAAAAQHGRIELDALLGGSILMTAMSVFGSVPTTLAVNSVPVEEPDRDLVGAVHDVIVG
ncbi:MAG: hypothetical protein R2882_14845 [Gemmatimonadales bacterium]